MRKPEAETELSSLDNVLVLELDVTNKDTITAAVAKATEHFGQIDVLINNAGYGCFGLLEATPAEKVRRQYDVNVFGLIETMQAVLPQFRARKDGVIINITSVGGVYGVPICSVYNSTKFAVEGLTEAAHYELSSIGVRAKLVEPGAIKTDFASRSLDMNTDASLTEYQEFIGKIMAAWASIASDASEAVEVAEKIFEAATDGTSTLRYSVGGGAPQRLAARKKLDDATFFGAVKARFSL